MTRLALVTGGGGFIGGHLARALHARGERVRVLDIAGAPGLPPEIEVLRASILDRPAVDRALDGVDTVYHLAADPNLWSPQRKSFLETNLRGTLVVLAASRAAGTRRVVHTSTESILRGNRLNGGGPLNEETARSTLEEMPGSYCRSKFLAEQAALDAAGDGLPLVIVNPTMPMGPGDRHLTPPSRMLLDFLNGRHAAFLDWECNIVDARDAALGHILAAEHGEIGHRYILGGHNIRLRDLLARVEALTHLPMPTRAVPYAAALLCAFVAEFVAGITRRPPVAPLAGVRLARSPLIFDSGKATRALGFASRPLEETLIDAVRDFARRKLLHRSVVLA
jgi:hopanoid-associated sugar epimerase